MAVLFRFSSPAWSAASTPWRISPPFPSPGSWIEIHGTNLAPDTRSWLGSDSHWQNNAPTSLDGVKVTAGGQAAFVEYISSVQVNAQLPSNARNRRCVVQLTVTNGTVTSAPVNITVSATEPGLLAPASFPHWRKTICGGPVHRRDICAAHRERSRELPRVRRSLGSRS